MAYGPCRGGSNHIHTVGRKRERSSCNPETHCPGTTNAWYPNGLHMLAHSRLPLLVHHTVSPRLAVLCTRSCGHMRGLMAGRTLIGQPSAVNQLRYAASPVPPHNGPSRLPGFDAREWGEYARRSLDIPGQRARPQVYSQHAEDTCYSGHLNAFQLQSRHNHSCTDVLLWALESCIHPTADHGG